MRIHGRAGRITEFDIEMLRARGYPDCDIAEAVECLASYPRADELILMIDRAFDGVTLGDGISLHETDGLDNYAGEQECKRLREQDEKLNWRRVHYDDLHISTALAFLDDKGLYFYTPAFLTAELRGYFDGFIEGLIHNTSIAAHSELPAMLSPEQRHTIIACISFYGSIKSLEYAEKDITEAILRYSLISKPS